MNYQSGALKDVAQQNPICETAEMTSLLDHFFVLMNYQSGALKDVAQQNPIFH